MLRMRRGRKSELLARSINFKLKADTMFVIDDAALVRYAARLYLENRSTYSLADWAAASKVIDLDAARSRLRPPSDTSAEHG
jgi:sensor domain CHASE-containing protein